MERSRLEMELVMAKRRIQVLEAVGGGRRGSLEWVGRGGREETVVENLGDVREKTVKVLADLCGERTEGEDSDDDDEKMGVEQLAQVLGELLLYSDQAETVARRVFYVFLY